MVTKTCILVKGMASSAEVIFLADISALLPPGFPTDDLQSFQIASFSHLIHPIQP